MGQQGIWDHIATAARGVEGASEIDGVPECDSRCNQGQTARPMLLRLGGAVAQASEPVEADGAGERVARLALVQRYAGDGFL